MKFILLVFFCLPALALAHVEIGEVKMFRSGPAGSMHLTQFGHNALANDTPMALGSDGNYVLPSGQPITIQMVGDHSAVINVFNPNGTRVGYMMCKDEAL